MTAPLRPSSPPPAPPRSKTPLQRRLIAAFTERLPLKAAALVLSLLLWILVSTEEPAEVVFPVRLALQLDSGVALRGEPPEIKALVAGRGREFLKLYANPPTLRRRITGDVADSLHLDLRPADIDVPSGGDLRVRDVDPRAVTLYFDVTAQRVVPVRSALRVTADTGVRITGAPKFEPDSVLVRGRRGAVRAVASVPTSPASLVVRDTTSVVVPLDTAGLRVTVTPSHVRVRVPAERDGTPNAAQATLRRLPRTVARP